MAFVCFALPLLIWGGFIEVSTTPKWLFLSLSLPVLICFHRPRWTWVHLCSGGFVLWGALTLLWSPAPLLGLPSLWHFLLLWLALAIGSALDERQMKRCLLAFCLGMVVNAAAAAAQTFGGWDFIPEVSRPAGMFGNGNWLAEAGLLGVVSALVLRRPLLALGCAPAWILPLSRNALIAGWLLAVVWLWKRTRAGAVAILLIGVGAGVYHARSIDWQESSVALRASLYANTAVMALDHPLGAGLGSYWTMYPLYHDAARPSPASGYKLQQRPHTAHNDALTVLAETGVPGLLLLALVFVRRGKYSWITNGVLALGLFAFPLFQPVTAFLGFLVAGHLSRALPVLRHWDRERRMAAETGRSAG